MARAAAAGFIHRARTLLWVLWIFTRIASPTGASSLCYNFTSCKSESGSWFNGVQGLLNKKIFLAYNSSSNKYQYFGLLENRLKGTQVWTEQHELLEDTIDLLKQQLLDIKTTSIHRAPITTVPDTALGASAAVTIRPCVLLVTLTCSLMLLILENPPR